MAFCRDPLGIHCMRGVFNDGQSCSRCLEEQGRREDLARWREDFAKTLPPQQGRAWLLLHARGGDGWMKGEEIRIGISSTMRGAGIVLQRLLERSLVSIRVPPGQRYASNNMQYEWKAREADVG